MADNSTDRSSITQTGDHRPAPGAANVGFGRTSEDLATNSPATFGPDPLAPDRSDLFSGDDADNDDQAPVRTARKRNSDIPPDERLGLRPTIRGDAAPDTPVNKDLYGA